MLLFNQGFYQPVLEKLMFRFVPVLLLSIAGGILSPAVAAETLRPELQRLSKAVQLKTISHQDPARLDTGPFDEFSDMIRGFYPRTFSELEVTVISNFSFLLKWQGSDDSLKPVLVDAHYDVVPVEPGTENDWRFEPYSGAVEDGYLLGRGALDNKSPVMATFEAIEKLLAAGHQPKRTLYYSLGHDEEIGGNQGAANIAKYLKEQGVTFEYMLGEGGLVIDSHPMLPDSRVVLVNLAQKGYLTLTLSTSGQGGHSSSPTEDNALARLAEAVSRLHNNPFAPKLVSPVSDMLSTIGEKRGGLMGLALSHQWLTSSFLIDQLDSDRLTRPMVTTTTAVTMFNAGVKENVIPQRAEAKVNFRLLPGDTKATLIEDVKDIINDPEVQVSASDANVIPRVADMNAPGYALIKQAAAEALPDAEVVPGLLIATTDTKHYEDLCENVYHFQPMFLSLNEAGGIHGTNERIKVADYLDSLKLAEATLRIITTQ